MLRRLGPDTGEITTPVDETDETRVDPTPQLGEPAMVHVLDSGEILWWCQRDGWGHLHLYAGDLRHFHARPVGMWPTVSLRHPLPSGPERRDRAEGAGAATR